MVTISIIFDFIHFSNKIVGVVPATSKTRRFVDISCTGEEQILSQCTRTIIKYGVCENGLSAFKCKLNCVRS